MKVYIRNVEPFPKMESLPDAQAHARAKKVAADVEARAMDLAVKLIPADNTDIDFSATTGKVVVVELGGARNPQGKPCDETLSEAVPTQTDATLQFEPSGEIKRLYAEQSDVGSDGKNSFEFIRTDAGLQYFMSREAGGVDTVAVFDEKSGMLCHPETEILAVLRSLRDSYSGNQIQFYRVAGGGAESQPDVKAPLQNVDEIVQQVARGTARAKLPSLVWWNWLPRYNVQVRGLSDLQRLATKFSADGD